MENQKIYEITMDVAWGKDGSEFVFAPGTRVPAGAGDENFIAYVLIGGQRVGLEAGECYEIL